MKVEARDVRRRFGAREALRALDFAVPAGTRVALVGANGSGKSTLCRALVGLLSVQGALRIDGLDPRRDRGRLAPRIAYVPQTPPPLAAPVGELVRAVARLRGLDPSRIDEAAARLALPLERLRETPVRGLSGGMRQKLVLALALAGRSELLLLDEPTGSLDPESRERFLALFDERAEGATVILASHRLDEIRQLVDHVIELHEGRLLREGPIRGFLHAAARSAIELRLAEPAPAASAAWLEAQGFRRARGGWWSRIAKGGEKVALVGAATRTLGDALEDVAVRELGLQDRNLEEDGHGRS